MTTKSARRYYSQENQRHADSHLLPLTWEKVVEMTHFLTDAYGHPRVLVSKTKSAQEIKKRNYESKSWYRDSSNPEKREIVYHPSMFNPLTVAHEVAHYLNDQRQRAEEARIDKLFGADFMQRTDEQQAAAVTARKAIDREVHGYAHRDLVDRCVEKLKERYDDLYARKFTDEFIAQLRVETAVLQAVLAKRFAARRMQQDFFRALPERLTCARCGDMMHKREFGVRVMKRDAEGMPTKMATQSYCKCCRSLARRRWSC